MSDVFSGSWRCRCCHDGPYPVNADGLCFPCSERPDTRCRGCMSYGKHPDSGLCDRCEQRRAVADRRHDGPVPLKFP